MLVKKRKTEEKNEQRTRTKDELNGNVEAEKRWPKPMVIRLTNMYVKLLILPERS